MNRKQLEEDKKCLEFLISLHRQLLKNPSLDTKAKEKISNEILDLSNQINDICKKL